MIFRRLTAVLLMSLPLAPVQADQTEDRAAIVRLADHDERLARVAHRLAVRNAALCRETTANPGIVFQDIGQYPIGLQPLAKSVLGFATPIGVGAVVRGGAADRAGIVAGDGLVAIGDNRIDTYLSASNDAPADNSFERMAVIENWLIGAFADGSAVLTFSSDGTERALTIDGDTACASLVQVLDSSEMQASANGRYVQVTSALMDYVRTDDELAVIVAHELAHNILGHRRFLEQQKVSRGLFAGFGKSGRLWRETEAQADRLGIYLMHNAGYDTRVAVAFWERYGRATDQGIFSDGTHLNWKKRIVLIEQERAAIAANAGPLPIIPALVAR